jgi:hypothetical protein
MLSEGRTGLISAADGTVNPVRLDKTGAITIVSAHPLYSEASLRGKMFIASTAVAGVAPGTVLSTTPPLALLNPLNSGVDLAILKTSVGYISGTLGAGSIVYAYFTPQATIPSGGTELTPVCTKIGQIKGAGRAFQGSTLAGTPLIFRPAYSLGAFLATTADPMRTTQDLVEGEIVVPPATVFVMQAVAAAGTSPIVAMSVCWEEITQ